MALKIRLQRKKNRPNYRIVIADVRAPRDGRFKENVGSYSPLLPKNSEERVQLKQDRIKYWLSQGAKPTYTIGRFLGEVGLYKWERAHNPNKAKPGAKAVERLAEKAEKKAALEEAKKEADKKQKTEESKDA